MDQMAMYIMLIFLVIFTLYVVFSKDNSGTVDIFTGINDTGVYDNIINDTGVYDNIINDNVIDSTFQIEQQRDEEQRQLLQQRQQQQQQQQQLQRSPRYEFHQGKDSRGYDIIRKGAFANKINALKTWCNMCPKCKGFNTNGYMKSYIKPERGWGNPEVFKQKKNIFATKGLYVKQF